MGDDLQEYGETNLTEGGPQIYVFTFQGMWARS